MRNTKELVKGHAFALWTVLAEEGLLTPKGLKNAEKRIRKNLMFFAIDNLRTTVAPVGGGDEHSRMSIVVIQARIRLGTDIRDAIIDAKALAMRLGADVEFEFNGKSITVREDTDVDHLVSRYREERR